MASFTTNQFKSGLKFILDNNPCTILENQIVKPGKGQAFNRVKFCNLKTGQVNERTFKSGDSVQAADVMEIELAYSYTDDDFWYFMDMVTFEQHAADANAVADCKKWLKEQYIYTITQWNGMPLKVTAPNFVDLTVTDTDPGLKGDSASTGGKFATLETGVVVRVPLFIEVGELLRIDTRNGEYVERVKT